MLNREGLDVLVHPLTDDSVADHTRFRTLARNSAAVAGRCIAARGPRARLKAWIPDNREKLGFGA